MRAVLLTFVLLLLPSELLAEEAGADDFEHNPLADLIVPEVEVEERELLAGELVEAGVAGLSAESWEAAARQLEVSYILRPDPDVLLPLATALLELGHRAAALERLERLLGDHPDQGAESCIRARQLIEELRPSTVPVSVTTEPPGAALYLNDEHRGTSPLATPWALEEGGYELRVQLEGFLELTRRLDVRSGAPLSLNLQLEEALEPGGDGRALSIAFWTTVGVTAVSAVVLTIAAILGAVGTNDLEADLEPTTAESESVEAWVDTSFWLAGITGAGLTASVALAVARGRRNSSDGGSEE